ncbi:phage holin family protein [Kitasatospora sp. NPDC051914]|uniref:phage holin family protein n=1 Tax=Kitasatospora sp. NPDC051914 TaxID=3154945 RepID=UPI00342B4694
MPLTPTQESGGGTIALQMPVATAIIALNPVAGTVTAVAGLIAAVGKKEIGRATPPTPEQAVGSVKADMAEIKKRAHR